MHNRASVNRVVFQQPKYQYDSRRALDLPFMGPYTHKCHRKWCAFRLFTV